ncbi:histidine phosphotransferase family protein [Loktanella sp. F6476L]|uniref:histidine phosphotransferase family protein n=1 Tax=Loktanella sp. F6476L TaxID=2926405 RepID=UPI001FF2C3A4|nr:histidine phosphotransferase family protein [Loktanella sp. F6476L]MCK0121432.1 histidine phosphotransferase family protein [Loktanella sp. F6476L]
MRNDIAALVGSRICHDLISPIGAIGNGVELIGLTESTSGPEMALISESVENANARIRFFRVAFGAASADQIIGRTEVLSILSATAKSGRFTYYWQVDNDHARRDVRIAFLLLQCFETAFPVGGDITTIQDADTWTLTAHGDRMNYDENLWDSLTRPRLGYEHSAAEVQFALLPIVLQEARRTLNIAVTGDQITATFK